MDESQLVELSNGSVMANMRNNNLWNCNCRGIAISNNGGTTFTLPYPDPQLISPICEASIMSLNNGNIILFSNPSNDKQRVNMQIKKSINNDNTYNVSYSLCPSCDAAYSCLTTVNITGYFGLLWETNLTATCSGPSCQSVFITSLTPQTFLVYGYDRSESRLHLEQSKRTIYQSILTQS